MFTIGLLIYHTEVFCCHTNAQLFAEVVVFTTAVASCIPNTRVMVVLYFVPQFSYLVDLLGKNYCSIKC